MDGKGEIIIYERSDGNPSLQVLLEDESVWLTQSQIVDLFQSSKANVSEHIKHIFEEGELDENEVVRKFRTTASDGKIYLTNHYNLDLIISVGYRIKSSIATRFRKWATECLREYLIKGFAMDDERLKDLGGGNYWHELLDRIRDIRSSEKVMYRQVLDLYATATDYDASAPETIKFFKTVQNKLHYAIHGNTAPEIVFNRADAEKPFMGLKNFSGNDVTRKDIGVAKNYLDEKELRRLNNLVSAYFDLAENRAIEHIPTSMVDYLSMLDGLMAGTGYQLLEGAGKVSRKQADEKALAEYRVYQERTLSQVEEDYLESIRFLGKSAKDGVRGQS